MRQIERDASNEDANPLKNKDFSQSSGMLLSAIPKKFSMQAQLDEGGRSEGGKLKSLISQPAGGQSCNIN